MPLRKHCLFACAWLLLALAVGAQEQEFPVHNCAFTPPDGWEVPTGLPTRPLLVAAVNKPDRSVLLLLLVDDKNAPAAAMSEKDIPEMEKAIIRSGGGLRLWGRISRMDGVICYDRLGQVNVGGKDATFWTRTGGVQGRTYTLQAMHFGGDASEDPEVRKAFESFRFLKPPKLLPAKSFGSAAYRFGYLVGYAGGGLLCLGLVIAVPLVILRVVRKGKQTSLPPTLPPPY